MIGSVSEYKYTLQSEQSRVRSCLLEQDRGIKTEEESYNCS